MNIEEGLSIGEGYDPTRNQNLISGTETVLEWCTGEDETGHRYVIVVLCNFDKDVTNTGRAAHLAFSMRRSHFSLARQGSKAQFCPAGMFVVLAREGDDMIMRVYRCTAVAGKEAEFREFGFTNGHPWLRMQPGLVCRCAPGRVWRRVAQAAQTAG